MLKRGQISLFIILGIVLLGLFGLIYYIFPHSNSVDPQKTYTDIIRSTQIREYANLCLDKAAKEGLFLVGMQGGRIYANQANGTNPVFGVSNYGVYVLPFETNGTWYMVPISLWDRMTSKQPFFSEPIDNPDYPYIDLTDPGNRRNTSLLMDPSPLMPSPCPAGLECPFFLTPFGFTQGYPTTFGSYGTLMQLCDRFTGANMKASLAVPDSCETYNSYDGINSMPYSTQQFLEKYIKNQTEECLNLSSSLENLFPGYAVKVESPVVSVTIGDDDVSTYLTLPLVINISGNPVVKQLYFYNKKNVRLKLIHELATRIIRNNSMSIFFVPEDDYINLNDCRNLSANTQVQCAKDGMSVIRYADVCGLNVNCTDPHGKFADIINITDTKSDIDGKPYSFLFGVENRRPALDFIHETGDQNLNTLGDTYDIIVFQGDVINFTPFGYDPDKDAYNFVEGNVNYQCTNISNGKTRKCMAYNYKYSGWKADYEQEFNYSTVGGVEKTVGVWLTENHNPHDYQRLDSPTDYSFDPDNPDTGTNPEIIYRFLNGMGLAPDKKYTCLYDISTRGCNTIVNQWESSSEFSTPGAEGYKRIANYKTNRTDVGPHIVNITVRDNEGFLDYQEIRILVYKVKGPGDPGLPGNFLSPMIKNNYASIEDPYTLWINDPPAQIAPDVTSNTKFQWIDLVEGNPFPLPSSQTTLGAMPQAMIMLPNTYDGSYDITNPSASQYRFSVTDNGNSANPHRHILNLTTTSPKHEPTWDLYVYDCLPYRSLLDVAPYPYNKFAADPKTNPGIADYATNHVCCWGDTTAPASPTGTKWGTIKPPNVPCYIYPVDTCGPPGLISSQTPTGAIPPANFTLVDAGSVLTKQPVYPTCIGTCTEANAIYARTFTQYCGNRGNVCSGTVIDNWQEILNCNTINWAQGEDESCTGIFQNDGDYGTCINDVRNGVPISVQGGIPTACFNYGPGSSWEQLYEGGTGICNDNYKCTDTTYNDGGTTQICQAQCDGNGGCTQPANCQSCPSGCNANSNSVVSDSCA